MVPLVTIVNFVPRRVREGQHILHAEVCTENERCDFRYTPFPDYYTFTLYFYIVEQKMHCVMFV